MGKIILTSRVKDACLRMNAQKIIPMEILTEEEAWTLFKQKAGSYLEGSDLLPIAKLIVQVLRASFLVFEGQRKF